MDQYRATRIANQICVSCDNSVSGTTFKSCDECRTERRRKRAKQVRDGRCNSCGKPRENLDLTLCKPCRDSKPAVSQLGEQTAYVRSVENFRRLKIRALVLLAQSYELQISKSGTIKRKPNIFAHTVSRSQ